MVRTLVTGATGTLGTAAVPRLLDAGHEVRAASRSPPDDETDVEWIELDLIDGTGIEAAVADRDTIVHAATAPTGDSEAVDVEGTKRLLEAAERAGVSNFLYVSIVGIDEIPYSYYEHKLAAERAVDESDVPSTIVRATQFHSFIDEILGMLSWSPIWPLPTSMKFQPIDAGEVADTIVSHASAQASGRVPVVGGPEVLTLGEITDSYRQATGKRRLSVRVPFPGAVVSAFREGKATGPDRMVGEKTWEQWLVENYESADLSSAESATPTT